MNETPMPQTNESHEQTGELFTPTEKLFNANKQDWYVCSLGFRHELVMECDDVCRMQIRCPKCDWMIESENGYKAAFQEHEHYETHLGSGA